MSVDQALSIGQCASLACLLEVSAAKPGNVHRAADFADTRLNDFLVSAVAIAPVLERAVDQRVGRTVLAAIQATRRMTTVNTNLGMLLLLAPLAAVPRAQALDIGVRQILDQLGPPDAVDIYAAIRLANPGGLVPRDRPTIRNDIAENPPDDLREAMAQAAAWDLVARQYSNGFADVLQRVLPWLLELASERPLSERIVHAHVQLMSEIPDSLIARKGGQELALEASARATAVRQAGPPGSAAYWQAVADLDFWLRSDGNRRNPGTTADLIAAALFAGLRDGLIQPPFD